MSDRDFAVDSVWKTQKPHVSIKGIANPCFRNYTGLSIGSLLVTGYLGRGRWQLKCLCGNYFSGTSLSIKNSSHRDCCPECYIGLMNLSDNLSRSGSVEFADKYAKKLNYKGCN